MDKRIYDMFPQWSKEKQDGYKMLGSNDLDSLATQSILNQVFGYELNAYTNRDGIWMIDENHKQHIGVDIATVRGKTYDNHVTLRDGKSIVNEESANINAIYKINTTNYKEKCTFSTLIQVMSLLDIPLPTTDEGKMFLLSIDSSHYGHYNNDYKHVNNKWFELLGFTELIDIMNKYSKQDISKMRLSRKSEYLTFKDGHLTYREDYKSYAENLLGYELILPKEKFTPIAKLESRVIPPFSKKTDVTHEKLVFSCAYTGRDNLSYSKYSKIKKIGELII